MRESGRQESADKALVRARVLRPDEPRLQVNTANLWISTKLPGDPARALARALCLDPGLVAACERRLLLEKARGERAAAIRMANWCLCLARRSGPAYRLELAQLLFEAGDEAGAGNQIRRGVLECVDPEAIADDGPLGRLLESARRIGGDGYCWDLARQALCLSPASARVAREFAVVAARRATDRRDRNVLLAMRFAWPLDAIVWNGAGVLLEQPDDRAGARACYARAAVLDPALSIALFNVGVQARYRGDFHRAAGYFRRALVISRRDPIYAYNLGHVLLATGGWREGLTLFEERWKSGDRPSHRQAGRKPSFSQRFWDGDAGIAAHETVLVWGEQGVGDEVWFAGYVPRLLSNHRSVLECDSRLVPLFERSGLAGTVVARADPAAEPVLAADWQVAAGSLPKLAESTGPAGAFPAPSGYLKADSTQIDVARRRLSALTTGPTIGISWRSRKPKSEQSFEAPLAAWEPIFRLPGATFVNLQYGVGPAELRAIRARHGINLVGFEDIDPLLDLDALAALTMALDHVVSVANVTVALCHGLGRSCHVALRHYQEDWRYQRDRESSAWLPTCALYWPDTARPWGGVFSRIAEKLQISRPTG